MKTVLSRGQEVGRTLAMASVTVPSEPESGGLLDNLTIALCISIGTGVPWLIATYSENGARQLLENSVFGMVGVACGAYAFNWMSSTHALVALVSLGPVVTFLSIVAGQALKRAILSRLSRSP